MLAPDTTGVRCPRRSKPVQHDLKSDIHLDVFIVPTGVRREGTTVLNIFNDHDYNRSVITIVATINSISKSSFYFPCNVFHIHTCSRETDEWVHLQFSNPLISFVRDLNTHTKKTKKNEGEPFSKTNHREKFISMNPCPLTMKAGRVSGSASSWALQPV